MDLFIAIRDSSDRDTEVAVLRPIFLRWAAIHCQKTETEIEDTLVEDSVGDDDWHIETPEALDPKSSWRFARDVKADIDLVVTLTGKLEIGAVITFEPQA